MTANVSASLKGQCAKISFSCHILLDQSATIFHAFVSVSLIFLISLEPFRHFCFLYIQPCFNRILHRSSSKHFFSSVLFYVSSRFTQSATAAVLPGRKNVSMFHTKPTLCRSFGVCLCQIFVFSKL